MKTLWCKETAKGRHVIHKTPPQPNPCKKKPEEEKCWPCSGSCCDSRIFSYSCWTPAEASGARWNAGGDIRTKSSHDLWKEKRTWAFHFTMFYIISVEPQSIYKKAPVPINLIIIYLKNFPILYHWNDCAINFNKSINCYIERWTFVYCTLTPTQILSQSQRRVYSMFT